MFLAKIEFKKEIDHKFENKVKTFWSCKSIFKTQIEIKNFTVNLFDDVFIYSWNKELVLQTLLDILNHFHQIIILFFCSGKVR